MAHVFVRVAGQGLRLLPNAPFVMRAAGDAIELTAIIADEELHAIVRADEPLDERFGRLEPGPPVPSFWVEIGGVYQTTWPIDLALVSAPEPSEQPFFMFSDLAGGLVYVQGPLEGTPDRDAMIGETQTEVARGSQHGNEWIELAYDHKNGPWRQCHIVVGFGDDHHMVVTTQATLRTAPRIRRAADECARSITPWPGS